jgi:streptogramin lyase
MGAKARVAATALLMFAVVAGGAGASGGLPGARALKICAGAGARWPTITLALRGAYAWIACKEQARVIRVDTRTGRRTRSVRLGGAVIAVRPGFGSIWALDSGGTLYRLDPATGKVVRRAPLALAAAYNIWIGGGAVWVADDQAAQVVRVSPRTTRVIARVRTGDGPASMAFDGDTGWAISHRDTTLTRIDLTTNRSTPLARLGHDTPERMVWSRGSLWITGRGTDLLRVDPTDGSIEQTIEIGASGIDLALAGDDLWIPTRSEAVDQSGFPTMAALKRLSISTGVLSTVGEPRQRIDVHGLATAAGAVWIADNRRGYLYCVAR